MNVPTPRHRNVVWELDLAHPAPGRWLPVPVEALLFFRDAAGERVVQRRVLHSAAPANWSDTYHMDFFGWEDDYYYDRAMLCLVRGVGDIGSAVAHLVFVLHDEPAPTTTRRGMAFAAEEP
jgi:hypothetical protein